MAAPPTTEPAREPSEAEQIATAVAAAPEVAGLHGGAFGEVATYLPGRRIPGIRITDTLVAVHVTARWPLRLDALATAVRTAVATVTTRPVAITVEDLALPEHDTKTTPTGRSRADSRTSQGLPEGAAATAQNPEQAGRMGRMEGRS